MSPRHSQFTPSAPPPGAGGIHRRYALAAAEASERHQKPILVASDLVYTDRAYGNAGPLGVKESGRVAYASGHRAVRALSQMVAYSRSRARLS